MTMHADLRARLVEDVAVAAVVEDRVRWFERKRADGFPCLIINTIDAGRDYTHEGPDPLEQPRLQFDSYGRTTEEAIALSLAVRRVMETAETKGGTRFWAAFLESENTFAEGEEQGGGRTFRVSQDYTFFFEPVS